jgi:hypothetical protein
VRRDPYVNFIHDRIVYEYGENWKKIMIFKTDVMASANDDLYLVYKNIHELLKYRGYTSENALLASGVFNNQFAQASYIIIVGVNEKKEKLTAIMYGKGSKYLKSSNIESFQQKNITSHTICIIEDMKSIASIQRNEPIEVLPDGSKRFKYPVEFALYQHLIFNLSTHESMFIRYYLCSHEEVKEFENHTHRKINMLSKISKMDPNLLWSGLQLHVGRVVWFNKLSDTAGEAYNLKLIVEPSG